MPHQRVLGFYTKGYGKNRKVIPLRKSYGRTRVQPRRRQVASVISEQPIPTKKTLTPYVEASKTKPINQFADGKETMKQKEPWEMTMEEYKRLKGYEIFWAFRDYSPSQWAMMSERQRSQIEKQHNEEFAKNEKILNEHAMSVVHAIEEDKPVSAENRRQYADVVEKRQKSRQQYAVERQESIMRYQNAEKMSKSEFAKWWQEKELKESPQLKGFEHVMRSNANRYWRAAHGDQKGVPIFVVEGMEIDKARQQERKG